MNILPVSWYPAPSDDVSQAQVLGEQKSELRDQAAQVSAGGGDEAQKQAALESIEEKIADTDRQMKQKQESAALKKRDGARQAQRDDAKKARQEQSLAALEEQHRFNVRA